jgi:aryl-alcohol dehydrogenase-like predicted oxidoreductase
VEKRALGKTGLMVTALGYGAMELRHLRQAEAARLLNAVLDGGINFIDTSPDYGPSEAYIGQGISHRREEFYLATKCGCNVDQNGRPQDPGHIWSREKLLVNIENSLRVLKTDHIDVWQLHGTVPEDLPEGQQHEVIQTMQDLKRQGKVRFIAVSFKNGGPGDPLYPAAYGFKGIQAFMPWDVFDVMQIVYGALTRKSEKAIAKAADKGIGMIIRGVVKRYHGNYDELFKAAGLEGLLESDENQTDFMIRFALNHPGLSTMIIGTQNPDHLAQNIAAAEKGKLAADVYAEAKYRLAGVGVVADELTAA